MTASKNGSKPFRIRRSATTGTWQLIDHARGLQINCRSYEEAVDRMSCRMIAARVRGAL